MFSLCLLVGLGILFKSLHARPIMFVGGLLIGAIITGTQSERYSSVFSCKVYQCTMLRTVKVLVA